MRKTTRFYRRFSLTLVCLFLATLVVACGDNTATTAPAPAATTAVTTAAAAAATTAAAGAATTAAAAAAGASKPIPPFAGKPVNLQIIDVAGNLQLTKPMIENYKKANPDKVGTIDYLTATAPELAGKVKAQQDAGKLDIGLVMTGTDGLAAGIEQGLWTKLLPDYNAKFPGLLDNYLEPAKRINELGQGFGTVVSYYPSGPLFEYDPSKITNPPKTIEELKTWIKANPKKFMYARPANSGPGRTFMMGLPYLLGDKDPKDPINGWEKTWAFLKEIDPFIEYYPNGTSATMKELGEGTRWMLASTTGWDINPRVLGTVPKEYKIFTVENFKFVGDAHFMVIPKGLDNDRLAVVLDLMNWMFKPDQQAINFDKGYLYPGPAIKGVDISMAPADSQAAIKEFGRPEYDALIKNTPVETPLDAKNLVAAFEKWDKEIGGAKVKK
ncbi:MAG: transporter periplasmic substrate-binding protein [Chloroflexi bacterium]|jgi:putative spermidine/putrescine transport system substrate-binding protein|nr:transporter periplasmic substrate-binding protein [Chloroflexota bacterium]